MAFAMLTFAYSTESVNGVPGKKGARSKSTAPAPAGRDGTFLGGSDAGLKHGPTE